jgi:flagellar protein FliJ
MKSRETLIRLKKFHVEEKRRKVAQIEAMISEFERMASDLDREIMAEQERSGIHDPSHFAYPTYAKAALARRDNLCRSAKELKSQLEDAEIRFAEAIDELKKLEQLDERDQIRERVESARQGNVFDDIRLVRARGTIGA